MTEQQPSFLARLKQHHLYGVVVAYAVVAAFLIQLVSRVFPYYGWAGAVPAVITVLLLGFPVVVVLAWLLIKPKDPVKSDTWQRRHWKLSAAVTVAVIVLVVISGFYGLRYSKRYAARLEGTAVATVAVPISATSVSATPSAATVIPAKSVAVLPFANLSGDPKQVYFSDGITEEILNALAQIPDLKVAGRTSAFQFASKDEDVHKVGQILGVATVLEGSVQKAGDVVRITAQLIDTRSGYQLWSEQYDRKLTNIFTVEDDISNAIAGKLRVQLTGGAGQPLVAQKAVDPRAHDFYLQGLTLLAARGRGLRDAVTAFQSAVKIDPDYAQAWGALADAEVLLPSYGLADISAAQARAMEFAQHALVLDPNTASAYGTLGIVYLRHWQWAKADAAFRHSLVLAPSDAEAADQYAQFLFCAGQFMPALTEFKRAQKLDPLSAIVATMHAWVLFAMHRNAEADAQLRRALSIDPDFGLAHSIAAMRDGQAGRFSQALVHAESSLDPAAGMILTVRGMADPALRGKAVQELETSPSFTTLRDDPFSLAQSLALLGARDRALSALENLDADRASPEPMQIWSPALDTIRNDPRFKAVLKKMGLPYTPKNVPGVTAS